MSYTRRLMTDKMSSSNVSTPKRSKSGKNVVVMYGFFEHVVTFGFDTTLMLSRHVCLYFLFPSQISTSNIFEKIFVAFEPIPLRPAPVLCSVSSKFSPASRCPKISSGM
ncbi:hypothetical protein NY2A_b789R [Paramecium bursaria Chlorella virus NY2A]|uniref:Uncharacterized protein b789R n=1 Tax=Paramecium bursaria Chlorella virus NY2A TaxID=46021 RepID=A7IXW4_PBCVN|nr:hypothetical protein NY2A_b789R [Paramecium bursaria Chlorella virus NY2A]YP_001498794.1 hypothetical protein AR158_c713R [Paramecium bursaria Chlorella virus AR158]ABT15188.1 hypothetical protein NY2A_b789R [Paramecium bursaria Chlorella virus NY2A]ABU44258.1 hypothetical protein AR158_c713R [Paramecium bursaria Chlorella virus AR158]